MNSNYSQGGGGGRDNSTHYPAVGVPPHHILEAHFSDPNPNPDANSSSDIFTHPRFNPLKSAPRRSQSGASPNLNDSMVVHLLVETAIVDSSQYHILSYEEVEALKREYGLLANRIDASKRKLQLEAKVRDAAQSLSRLSTRRGKGGHAKSAPDSPGTDSEVAASNRKCEDLSQELWKLSNRSIEIQQRLLQHSVAILGMTHKTVEFGAGASIGSGSEYTYGNRAMSPGTEEFDDRSFYRTADKLEGFGESKRRMSRIDSLSSSEGRKTAPAAVEDEFLITKLEDLNEQLRDLLLSSAGQSDTPPPPRGAGGVHEQLSLLDQNIQYIRQHPPSPLGPRYGDAAHEIMPVLMTLWEIVVRNDEAMRNQKRQQQQNGYSQDYPESDEDEIGAANEFSVQAFSAKIQSMVNKMNNLRNERDLFRDHLNRQELGVEEDMKIMQEDLLGMENQVGQLSGLLEQREDDLTTANKKVHRFMEELKHAQGMLHEKSEELVTVRLQLETEKAKDHQRVLENKGLQHGNVALELEIKARADTEQRLIALENQLELKGLEALNLQTKLRETQEMLEAANQNRVHLESQVEKLNDACHAATSEESSLRQLVESKGIEFEKLDKENQELSGKVAELSTEVVMAKAELDMAYGSKSERAQATAEAKAAALALERANKQPQTIDPGLLSEIDKLERKNCDLIAEIVMLKNERAEGANNEGLHNRCKVLQKELDDMLSDYEILTKQGIESEQEREKLESLVDRLKERIGELEIKVAEEQIGSCSTSGSSGGRRPGGDSTSTTVLKQEFKKMMREMKTEQLKALKAEQEERRKLESMIRALKKEQLLKKPHPPLPPSHCHPRPPIANTPTATAT